MVADEALSLWLAREVGLEDAYVAGELGGGNSNITLLVEHRTGRCVLRRPPTNSISPLAARGVRREFDVLSTLSGAVPAPRPMAFCDDPAIIGVPFALFSFLPGVAITTHLPDSYLEDAGAVSRIGEALVDALATLHRVEPAAPGLPGGAADDGFLTRQIQRWVGIRRSDTVRDLPLLETLADVLTERQPRHGQRAVLHGDYHLDNTLFFEDRPVLSGIIDWELATVGDPLCDLGLVLAFWGPRLVQPAGFDFVQQVSRSEDPDAAERLAQRWALASGRDVTDLGYYRGFALWRLAAMVEGAYVLSFRGRDDRPYARRLKHDVPQLLEEAAVHLGIRAG